MERTNGNNKTNQHLRDTQEGAGKVLLHTHLQNREGRGEIFLKKHRATKC